MKSVIHYALVCENAHKFEAWFRNAEAYDEQAARGIVSCPVCGSAKVDKAIMAPAVARTDSGKAAASASGKASGTGRQWPALARQYSA